jgi:NaMN:DMB phosphoribosyltransferase
MISSFTSAKRVVVPPFSFVTVAAVIAVAVLTLGTVAVLLLAATMVLGGVTYTVNTHDVRTGGLRSATSRRQACCLTASASGRRSWLASHSPFQ